MTSYDGWGHNDIRIPDAHGGHRQRRRCPRVSDVESSKLERASVNRSVRKPFWMRTQKIRKRFGPKIKIGKLSDPKDTKTFWIQKIRKPSTREEFPANLQKKKWRGSATAAAAAPPPRRRPTTQQQQLPRATRTRRLPQLIEFFIRRPILSNNNPIITMAAVAQQYHEEALEAQGENMEVSFVRRGRGNGGWG